MRRVVCPLAERDFDGPDRRRDALRLRRLRRRRLRRSASPRTGPSSRARAAGSAATWRSTPCSTTGAGSRPRRSTSTTASSCWTCAGRTASCGPRLSQNRRRQLRDWASVGARLEHDREALTDVPLGRTTPPSSRGGAPGRATDFTARRMAAFAGLDDVLMVGAGRADGSSPSRSSATPPTAPTTCSGSRSRAASATRPPVWWRSSGCASSASEPQPRRRGAARGRTGGVQAPLRRGAAAAASLRQVYGPEAYERPLPRRPGSDPDRVGWFPPYRAPDAPGRWPDASGVAQRRAQPRRVRMARRTSRRRSPPRSVFTDVPVGSASTRWTQPLGLGEPPRRPGTASGRAPCGGNRGRSSGAPARSRPTAPLQLVARQAGGLVDLDHDVLPVAALARRRRRSARRRRRPSSAAR